MMISVKTFMHQKQTLAKISGPKIMFAETHTRVQEMWGGGGKWGAPYGCHMSQNLHWNTQFLRFKKNHYIISRDSKRAGSRTLEKFSRRDRDRDCAKFESSRRFRGSNMNPKKKSRRYRASISIQALDLAISRFTHSLAPN
jgi:hypothetical protein